jgi:hypothetical protein
VIQPAVGSRSADRELFLALMMRQLVADRHRLPDTLLADAQRECRALLEGKEIRTVPRTALVYWTSRAFPMRILTSIVQAAKDWPEPAPGTVT